MKLYFRTQLKLNKLSIITITTIIINNNNNNNKISKKVVRQRHMHLRKILKVKDSLLKISINLE